MRAKSSAPKAGFKRSLIFQMSPFAGLELQINYMSVHLGCVYSNPANERWFREAWAKTGNQFNLGKSCLHFTSLDDPALDVIGEVIRRTPVRAFINYDEAVAKTLRRRSVGRTTLKPLKVKAKRPAHEGKAEKLADVRGFQAGLAQFPKQRSEIVARHPFP